jgi:hypothetical protein
LDKSSPEIIKFKFANSDHRDLIVGTNLGNKQGLSHSVFADDVTKSNRNLDLEEMSDEDVLLNFKHKYVPEVVRNPNMHYWKVPRLGSYMAIPLVYKSCLSVNSYTTAVDDYNKYLAEVKRQKAE